MPDTTYITPEQFNSLNDSLPPEVRQQIERMIQNRVPEETSEGGTLAISIIIIAAMLIAGLVRYFMAPGKGEAINYADLPDLDKLKRSGHQIRVGNEGKLTVNEIRIILQKHSPYYNGLNPPQQTVFAKRVLAFMSIKVFVICNYTPYREIPVLLSAAAVQITFGLERYQLPWYHTIIVHPSAFYVNGDKGKEVVGFVRGRTITVAWNEFISDFKEPADGVNVGLHEMAHALYTQKMEVNEMKPEAFEHYFMQIWAEGKELYELKHQHTQQLFTDYAYTSLHEFWAESVEIFFERPADMKQSYPDLYEKLSLLLNQDPLYAGNPVLANQLS
jgi:MtfA peptidase